MEDSTDGQHGHHKSSTDSLGFRLPGAGHLDYKAGFSAALNGLCKAHGATAVPPLGGRSNIASSKDSTEEPTRSQIHRVSTSTVASGASAGTHGYTDNTHDKGWRSGSYSTARQRCITNTVRGVRASRGWSASAPRKAVSDPRVSGWGPGRGHPSAVQTAGPHREGQPCHGQPRSTEPTALDNYVVIAKACGNRQDRHGANGSPYGSVSTFGRSRGEDIEGSSCNPAAGVTLTATAADPQPFGVQEGPTRRARMFV